MAYQPKSYRKFLAGSVTAALVASSVAPLASAATSFTDMPSDETTATAISTLVDLGVIQGYPDGTFKPYELINRGQAAKMLVEALADVEPKTEGLGKVFTDLSEKSYFSAYAEAIADAGIINGYPDGSFGAGNQLTREQMAKIIVNAFGLEDNGTEVEIADLASVSQGQREYVKILAQHEITVLPGGEFMPKEPVKRSQFALFVYRAMLATGEVVVAPEVVEITSVDSTTLHVKIAGELTEVAATDFTFDGDLEVKEAKIVTEDATAAEEVYTMVELKTSVQEAGKTYNLLTFLGKEVTTDVSIEVPAAVTPEVTSVSAINLKSFVINFNKAVDTKTVTTTTVKAYKGTSTTAATVTVTPAADGKSATVVFDTGLNQSDSFKVVVDGVKTSEGTALAKFESTQNAVDVTAPEAVSAVVKNSKQVEITFSEAINEATLAALASNYTTRTELLINGNPVVAKVTPDYAGNKLVLDFTTSLPVGSHKLTVKNVKDFAGFPIATKEFDLTVVSDSAAPQVASVKVLNKELVEVNFNEAVSTLGTININGVNIGGYTATTVTSASKLSTGQYMKSADGLTYTFRLGSAVGATALLNGIKLDYIGTSDVEGNTVASKVEIAAEVSDDTVAPTATVELIAANDSTRGLNKGDILITFSEEMATVPAVELKNASGTVVNTGSITFASTSTFGYQKAVVIPASTTGLNNVDGGSYTLTVKDATDNGLRSKPMTTVTNASLTAVDTKLPSVSGVVYTAATGAVTASNPDKVTIYFSEAMDKSTIENAANYLLTKDNDAGGGAVFGLLSQESTFVSAVAAADNKSVTIKFSTTVDADGTNEWAFKLLGVKDANGNAYTSINTVHEVAAPVALTASDLTFELVAKDEVKVKVTKAGSTLSNLDPNEVQFLYDADATAGTDVDTVFAYGTSIKSMNSAKTEAVIKLSSALTADGKARVSGSNYAVKVAVAKVGDATAASVNTKDGVGTLISLVNTANDANLDSLTDKVAPSLVSATIGSTTAGDAGNGQIVLTFDEEVDYTNTALINALVVKDVTNDTILSVSDFTVEADDNDSDIVITITKSGVANSKFSVALGNGSFIADTASNTMSPIAATTVKKADGTDALLTERTFATPVVDNTAATAFDTVANTDVVSAALVTGGTATTTGASVSVTNGVISFTGISATDGQTVFFTATDAAGNVLALQATYTAAGTAWAITLRP